MTIEAIEAELAKLHLAEWNEDTAMELGHILVEIARGRDLPVVIDIRDAGRCFFHAALPGSSAQNDNWARRKSNLALYMGRASMAVALKFRAEGRGLESEGLNPADYALSGGAVPLRLGEAMVAVATVSGLPEREDHDLVVEGLKQLTA